MQLRTLAEIATIIGVAIAVLGYMKIKPNILDQIPEIYKNNIENNLKSDILKINKNEYSRNKEYLYNLYKASLAIESSYSQDLALSKVISIAINTNDFKIAILSAKKINSSHLKSNELTKIVKIALKNKKFASYSVLAAELIPSSYSKDAALKNIISFYENKDNNITIKNNLTRFDKYKEIFRFADSTASMDMNENEVKEFTENWLQKRTYKDFLYFKKIFKFADSTANLDMSEEKAIEFAINWIDNYTENEFKIFKTIFQFADSTAGMSMSTKEAIEFALKKLKENRILANKLPIGHY